MNKLTELETLLNSLDRLENVVQKLSFILTEIQTLIAVRVEKPLKVRRTGTITAIE